MRIAIIGGGFYGSVISLFVRNFKEIKDVVIFEKESQLLKRASDINQARIHNGYHYPRSFSTGYRSHFNFGHFLSDWENCIKNDFISYYAIARNFSKINSNQFIRFCNEIESPLEEAKKEIKLLFNEKYIENVFKVKEFVFDSNLLRKEISEKLKLSSVNIKLNSIVTKIQSLNGRSLQIDYKTLGGEKKIDQADIIFNCTYSGISRIDESLFSNEFSLKHEIAELALIKMPKSFPNFGFTILDGPFLSCLPYPSENCFSLSHVRYTPQFSWIDKKEINPYERLDCHPKKSRISRILRDGERYIPIINKSKHIKSLYEIKTVLANNEIDDGRPILFKEHPLKKNFYSILGAKIDNIYDVLEFIDKLIRGF